MGARAGLLIAALALGLLGCGESGRSGVASTTAPPASALRKAREPARQILDEAAVALAHAHSVAMHGELKVEGRLSRISLEEEQPGRLRIGIEHGEASASVIRIGSRAYMKADAALLGERSHMPSGAVSLLANRWLAIAGSEAAGLKELDVKELGRCLLHETGSLVVDGVSETGGRPTITITDKGDVPGSTPARYYVAATGPPLLLRAVATGSERPGAKRGPECGESGGASDVRGELDFSRYNEPMHILAPAGALTPQQLGRQLAGQLGA